MAKRSNLKLKSVTIIHSATTETVRLPDDNNGVIVHTAVRTKVPFKKKVRGERSSSNNNQVSSGSKSKLGGGSKPNKAPNTSNHTHARASKIAAATTTANVTATATASNTALTGDIKKPPRTKKNRVAGSAGKSAHNIINAVVNAEKANQDIFKKTKKKKLNKEIIDYSSRTAAAAGGPAINHTNTFGKVQKWLLESPIVAQPLSHIEHSSKVRKVMSKSQSTPERLAHKTPTKSKSMGNLSNEKVKLQVVYKPPFRFALRLSKNTKVKTHVTGNITNNKFKRHSRSENKRSNAPHQVDGGGSGSGGVGGATKSIGEKTKRAALLLRSNNDEDNQILTLNEPNYETLNPKTAPSKMENPFYENIKCLQANDKRHSDPAVASEDLAAASTASNSAASTTNSVHRSSSKSNLDQSHHFQRSSSSSNPFAVAALDAARSSRKLSDSNADNLSRNFGSTQNLISNSQSNSNKSKKRSSLNLKSSLNTKNSKDPPLPTKKSSSNLNLRRDSVTNPTDNLKSNKHLPAQSVPLRRSISNSTQTNQKAATPLAKSSSSSSTPAATAALPTQLPSYNSQRSSRASFSNIPRASLSLVNSSSSNAGNTSPAPTNHANFPLSSQLESRRNRSSLPPPPVKQPVASHQRSNSVRQHPHNHHPPPLPTTTTGAPAAANNNKSQSNLNYNSSELPSDLEVMVSDIENLVS